MKIKFHLMILLAFFANELFSQNALDFDGANDYVQTTSPPLSGGNAKTVEAWIKTTANANPGTGGSQRVIIDMGSTVTGGRFTFNVLWSNAIRLEVGGSGLSGHISVNDGNWHHVAGVYDPLATLKFQLYVDGVLDTAGNIPTTVGTSSTGNIIIGKRVDNVNYFDGSIDEVRVWNTARSASEIANNRNAEFCALPQGLVAYYNFNRGTAGGSNSGVNKLFDAVAGKDGTLNGFSLSGSSSNWVSGPMITKGLSVNSYSASACDSLVSPSGQYVWASTGVYVDTMTNAASCDSLIRVNLMISPSLYTKVVDTVCGSYQSPSGRYTYTSSGTYFDTLATPGGCDWVFELDLNITIIDTTVSQTGSTLSANQNNATFYRWLDCAQNYAPIGGASSQVFSPAVDGDYAVKITLNGCEDTSACISVFGVGISDMSTIANFELVPNPVSDRVEIRLSQIADLAQYVLYSTDGKVVLRGLMINTDHKEVNLSQLQKGMYFLDLRSGDEVIRKKLMVQ